MPTQRNFYHPRRGLKDEARGAWAVVEHQQVDQDVQAAVEAWGLVEHPDSTTAQQGREDFHPQLAPLQLWRRSTRPCRMLSIPIVLESNE